MYTERIILLRATRECPQEEGQREKAKFTHIYKAAEIKKKR